MTDVILRTADLCDAHPDRVRVLMPGYLCLGGLTHCHGPVETVRTHEDNSKVRDAVNAPGEGRVLVINGGGSTKRSLVGGDLAEKAAANGWRGIIVDGAVRDRHELEAIDIAIFAWATVPMKTEKRGLGERGIPISAGGISLRPGDWIYADPDGIIAADIKLHD